MPTDPAPSREALQSILDHAGRFEIRRQIGAGAFGTVFDVFDRERDTHVALKTLDKAYPSAIYQFKQEFRSLADVVHPNLVGLHELFCLDDRWFFTMDLIDGVALLDYLRGTVPASVRSEEITAELPPSAPGSSGSRLDPSVSAPESSSAPLSSRSGASAPDEARLRETLTQLVRGVSALHQAGKLHRDLKPSNVLVQPDGRVVILDFGLVWELDQGGDHLGVESHIFGTPAYASPEQMSGAPIGPASDWYAFGVILYEALTGRRPHEGPLRELLHAKLLRDAVPPDRIAPGAPADLARLATALVSRDPASRPGPDEILRTLGARRSTPAHDAPRDKRQLFGRDAEILALHGALDDVIRNEKPVVVHLQGLSGLGKSALISGFVASLTERQAAPLVLRGRCYEQESVPYKGLDSLVDSLAKHLAGLSQADAAAAMPLDAAVIGRVFPVLMRVPALAQSPRIAQAADDVELRRRAFSALRELFARIAFRRPLVLCVDDLQWADVDSATFLRDLVAPPMPPPLLLVASYREDELEGNEALHVLPRSGDGTDVREVLLRPLREADSKALALSLFASEDGGARDAAAGIAREAVGNPFFVKALVRYVEHARESGQTNPTIELGSVLGALIDSMPGDARQVIETVAVAGVPRPIGLIANASRLHGAVQDALLALRKANLVRMHGLRSRDAVEIYHDRVRQAVLGNLPPDRLKELHLRMAEALERTAQADPEALVAHFAAAGDEARAGAYMVAAAERASSALAFSRAAALYRQAIAAAPQAERDALRVRLADALSNCGRGAEAADVLLEVAKQATGERMMRLRQWASGELFKCGHVDRGTQVLARVAREAGFYYPLSDWGAVLFALWSRVRLFLRGVRHRLRSADEIAPRELAKVDLCLGVGAALSNIDPVRGLDFQTRGLLLALRLGEPERVGRALVTEAGFLAISARKHARRIIHLLDLAERLFDTTPDSPTRDMYGLVTGMWHFFQGNWKQGFDDCDKAAASFAVRPTATWELTTARHYAIWCLFYLGRVGEMSRRVRQRLRTAREDGDLYSATDMATANSNVAWLALDDPAEARRIADEAIGIWSQSARSGFHVQHFFHVYAQVQADLYEGKAADAWNHLQASWRPLSRSLIRMIQHSRVEAVQLRARAALAMATQSSGADKSRMLRVARKDAASLLRENGPYSEGYAALIHATAASLDADRTTAIRLLNASVSAFENADMLLHAAAARWRLGELCSGEDGERVRRAAEEFLRTEEIRNPARLVAMLAPGFDDRPGA